MFRNVDPTGTALCVVCDGVEWPDDPELRREMAHRIENTLCAGLDSVGIPAAKTTIYNRYIYSQVECRCPVCQGDLEVGTFESNIDEWAYVPVECRQCGWSSRAAYSLTDYHDEITLTDLAGGATSEAVAKYDDLNPRYDTYPRLIDQTGQLR